MGSRCGRLYISSSVAIFVTLELSRHVARGASALPGSPIHSEESPSLPGAPNRHHLKYAHALDLRALKMFGYNTFCKKQLKPSELTSKGLKMSKFPPPGCARNVRAIPQSMHRDRVYTGLGSPPKNVLPTHLSWV